MSEPKKSVQKMSPYNPPTEGRKGFIRLDFNENALGCSAKALEAIRNVDKDFIMMYPEYSKFYRKLSSYLGIRESQIVISNGGDEAIKLIIDVYLDKNDEIIIPVPTFPMFKFYAEIVGGKIKEVPYNRDLSFPAERILKQITKKTRIVVLVNPNNPTGTPIEKKDVIKILKKAKHSFVILDEAYIQFSKENCADLIEKYDNLAIIRSFSKVFGLAGLRLGYVLANESVIKNLRKASSPYSVNNLAIVTASATLDDKGFIKAYVKGIVRNRERLLKEFESLNIRTYPSEANFILANFGKNADKVERHLRKRGILVRNQSEKKFLEGCIRVTVGTSEQNAKLIKALKEIL